MDHMAQEVARQKLSTQSRYLRVPLVALLAYLNYLQLLAYLPVPLLSKLLVAPSDR